MEPGTNGNKVSTEFEILTFERGKNRSKCVCTLFHICLRSYNFHCYLIMGMSYCLVSFPSSLKNRNCLPHLFYSRGPCQVCRGPPGGPWLSPDPDTECRKPAIFEFRGKMAGLPLSQPPRNSLYFPCRFPGSHVLRGSLSCGQASLRARIIQRFQGPLGSFLNTRVASQIPGTH